MAQITKFILATLVFLSISGCQSVKLGEIEIDMFEEELITHNNDNLAYPPEAQIDTDSNDTLPHDAFYLDTEEIDDPELSGAVYEADVFDLAVNEEIAYY